jgi:hypothetical protein
MCESFLSSVSFLTVYFIFPIKNHYNLWRCCLLLTLICISTMINDGDNFVMYILATCLSSFEKCLFISFAIFYHYLFSYN